MHLIVDDNEFNRLIMKLSLNKLSIDVDEVSSGKELINLIKQHKIYDIIWLDIIMPNIDGIECIKLLRNKYNYTGPVIGVSGLIDNDTIEECINNGMNEVLKKPFDEQIINDIVNTYVPK
jgi:CheY-like chemotaxis protein